MLLAALHLPTICRPSPGCGPAVARVLRPGSAPGFCARADKAGWPAARLLAAPAELELAEPELAERERRRIQRHLVEARLPPGKTLDAFDFTLVPTLGKARPMALVEGDAWLKTGRILLAFGPPGAESLTLRPGRAMNWSGGGTMSSAPERPTSSSACRSHGRP